MTEAHMRTGESERPITFAGTRLGRYRHVCAFFNTRDEEYRVFLPFIKEGLSHGEKAFHIVDPTLRRDHVERLAAAGVDVAAVEKSGQLELRIWQEAYLRGGHFDQAAMLALIEEVLTEGKRRGFPLTRLVAHMEWALEDRPGVDDLVEYETRLNYILAKFGAGVVMDILRTHPMAVIAGVLQENPFFVPPDEFLRELRARAGNGNDS